MASPHLADQKSRLDPVDALRVLVADLQELADRLSLKEHSRALQQTLKSVQERVTGPRAVVMLMGEHAALKRTFLERMLGPGLTHVPNPVNGCTRLEYGAEPECIVTMPPGLAAVIPLEQLDDFLGRRGVEMPKHVVQAIRLPNPTLQRGLAVIDTPVIESDRSTACALECAEQTDAWIFVLNVDHALSEPSLALLRQLPEQAARLEIVVEGAEALSGEARLVARKQLEKTLRESCGITEPHLTLVASAATEGDEGSFWHGRFATFHSVMMLRGRERWLEATRALVANALTDTGAEIDFELKNIGLGLRQARLRLGLKDLAGLQTRFHELGRLDSDRPKETKPGENKQPEVRSTRTAAIADTAALGTAVSTATRQPPTPIESPVPQATPALPVAAAPPAATVAKPESDDATAVETTASGTLNSTPAAANAATAIGSIPNGSIPEAPLGEPTFVSFQKPSSAPAKRGISVRLSADVARLIRRDRDAVVPNPDAAATAEHGTVTLPWRIAGVAVAMGFACLILWAIWPRIHLPREGSAAQWDYKNQPPAALGSANGHGVTSNPNLPPPPIEAESGPDTVTTETPGAPPAVAAPPKADVRTQLPKPVPTADVESHHSKRRHHRRFLGLDKLWHWVRHGHSKSDD